MADSGPGPIPHFQLNVGARWTLTVCLGSETPETYSEGKGMLTDVRVGVFRQE